MNMNISSGGHRYNFRFGSENSMVMIGYFRTSGSDDVSAKILGGRHSDRAEYDGFCYFYAIKTNTGDPKFRCACPHPDYSTAELALAIQEHGPVRVQMW